MSNSEVRILRDEIARLISECMGHKKDNEDLVRTVGEKDAQIAC